MESITLSTQLHSVLSQKLVPKMDRRLLYATLFGKSAVLESHDKAIVAVNAKNVAVADVGKAESEAHRFLTVISEESAHLSQTVYGTGAEAESLRARLASYVDVEIIKAIVAIEPGPDKSHVRSGVIDIDLRAIFHSCNSLFQCRFVS
jgi:hypothetical protein